MPRSPLKVYKKVSNKIAAPCYICRRTVAPYAGCVARDEENRRYAIHVRCIPPPPPPPPPPKVSRTTAEAIPPPVRPQVSDEVVKEALAFMPPEVFKNGRWQSTESLIRGALHQAEGIVWIKTRPTALLGDDMGMGKTMQSLAAVDPFSPLLIITTASTQRNWQAEAEMWRPDLKPICVKKKDFRWPGIHEAIITCWSSLPMYDPPEGVEKHS